jgi:AcrR family transcriptional regulator
MTRAGTSASPRVADIVRAAGLSNDAFYRHFASKEELVAAIVEAGAERLVQYLQHQMTKERTPKGELRRWVEGIMSQASNREVAEATRAVLWNGLQVGDASRRDTTSSYGPIAALLHEPLVALGRRDPERDASVLVQAVMGRMQDFLWRRVQPTEGDVAHLVTFCLGAVGVTRRA